MRKRTGTALAGLAMGLAAGTAAYMLNNHSSMKSQKKALRKTATKAVKTVGDIVDNFNYMVR